MAIRFYSAFLILLSLAASCLSDPVQNPDTVFKRQTGRDGDQEATKNNTISLNEQLANLTETVKKLQYVLKTAKDTTMAQLSSLQSSVNTLNTAKDTTMAQLSSLQFSVKTLTTRVNSPVNLYQNCIEETRSCDVTVPDTQDDTTNIYVESCDTPPLPINREVQLISILSRTHPHHYCI